MKYQYWLCIGFTLEKSSMEYWKNIGFTAMKPWNISCQYYTILHSYNHTIDDAIFNANIANFGSVWSCLTNGLKFCYTVPLLFTKSYHGKCINNIDIVHLANILSDTNISLIIFTLFVDFLTRCKRSRRAINLLNAGAVS